MGTDNALMCLEVAKLVAIATWSRGNKPYNYYRAPWTEYFVDKKGKDDLSAHPCSERAAPSLHTSSSNCYSPSRADHEPEPFPD